MAELKSAAGLQAALAENGPRLATAAMAALLAVQAGFLVTSQNRGAAPGSTAGPESGAQPSPWISGAAQPHALQVPDIVAAHLFGEAARDASDANAPQTAVQLVLAGVLAVPDPQRGLAIIGPNAAAARLYLVGAAVPGGVRLHAVYPDRVLLDRGGVIESLLLPKKPALAAATPSAATPMQSPAQRLAALAQGGGGLLGGLVRAQPVLAGGKLSGYRIFPGGRASIGSFTKLGLRPGDLVTAVNGTQLDDVNRGNEILQTLSSAASATLTVQRNGQSQELNLNLETVVSDAENAAAQAAQTTRRGGAFAGPLNGGGRVPGFGGSGAAPGLIDNGAAAPAPAPDPEPEQSPSDQ